jgi:hypothetical protein
MVTRGFTGRQSGSELSDRIPPGQHLVDNFPVLTAGPTPRIDPADWTFTLKVGPRPVKAWSWSEFNALPQTRMTRDIHCMTSWSKFNTRLGGRGHGTVRVLVVARQTPSSTKKCPRRHFLSIVAPGAAKLLHA